MLDRREFVLALMWSAALQRGVARAEARPATGRWVNALHSRLNSTRVASIQKPAWIKDLQSIVRKAQTLCIAGGRHAMGGQQFASDATLIDMNSMNHVLGFDEQNGIIEVES